MGFLRLLKASASSVKAQKELERAMDEKDRDKARRLISDYITEVLENGLTKKQRVIFDKAWRADQRAVTERLIGAFLRGWMEGTGKKKFSKALSETFLETQLLVKENK